MQMYTLSSKFYALHSYVEHFSLSLYSQFESSCKVQYTKVIYFACCMKINAAKKNFSFKLSEPLFVFLFQILMNVIKPMVDVVSSVITHQEASSESNAKDDLFFPFKI